MKKIIFTVATVVALAGSTFAQKATLDNPFSLEGALGYSGGINWEAPTLRARYFVKENIAARVQLGLGDGLGTAQSETNRFFENADGTGGEGIQEINRMSWMAQIGGEYHLAGTDRLSPYFALGINFGGGSYKETWTMFDGTGYNANLGAEVNGSFSMFGVGLGAGIDYYVFENVYAGLELGLNYSSYNYADRTVDVTTTAGGASTTASTVVAGNKETYLSTGAASAAFRLGWRF
jgi:hypothetical protein